MNKEKYNQKIKDINELIRLEEDVLKKSQDKIRDLKNDLQKHKQSCNHKHDDGASALKETSYWHSSPYEYVDDWTGEVVEGDNGYTVYEKECTICGEEQ